MAEVSPFSDFANFTGNFTVADRVLEQDSRGNWKPATIEIVVTAVLEQKEKPQQFRRPGVDANAIYLKGYLVEPRPLPPTITPDSPCTATYNGMSGTFVLEFAGRDPYLQALGIDLVDELKGYFLPPSSFASAT